MKAGLFSFLLFCLASGVPALADAVRVAVAGDASLTDLVDVMIGEFSKQPELVMLDRTDLDKLGQEQALLATFHSQDYSPLRVLPVDGLVLLRAVTQKGKVGVFARLVAVQPGVVLREVALPDGGDPVSQAQALEKELAPYWPKLAALEKGKSAAYSLLGIRFEVDAPETRELERSVNVLLASRLAAEPNVFVLERWNLNDATFEKSLNPQQPAPFWTGSSLIDGSMRWKKESNRIEATLRLRPPQGAEISISDQDTPENLPALVDRLVTKIGPPSAEQVTWKPADEASHFVRLAQWCLDNRLFDEGREAIESAVALGDDSRAARLLQVKAYALEAYPNDLRSYQGGGSNYRLARITPDSLPLRVAAATHAVQLTIEYMKANHGFTTPKPMPENPIDLGLAVLGSGLRILCAAFDDRFHENHAREVADLRHQLQKLIGDLGEQLLPQEPSRERGYFLSCRTQYAGLLHETPEETLAFYRETLKSGNVIDGSWNRQVLFEYGQLRWPYLGDESQPIALNWVELGPPWMVAWDGRSPQKIKELWRKFIQDMATSSDPVQQCDALKFEFSSDRTIAERDAVLARFIAFLQQHTDRLSGREGSFLAAGAAMITAQSERGQNGKLRDELLVLYLNLLQDHVPVAPAWIDEFPHLVHFPGDLSIATQLLSALNDYEQWYRTQKAPDNDILNALSGARQTFYRNKPELIPPTAEPSAGFMPVPRFLPFWASEADRAAGQTSLDPYTMLSFENHIWFLTRYRHHQVFCVDPATMQVIAAYPIPVELDPTRSLDSERYRDLAVSSQGIAVSLNGQVLLYSRTGKQWRALDLPLSSYMPRWIDEQLYLLYNARFGDQLISFNAGDKASAGSGLIRVSLPEGTCENLISSRRIPPQTILDGQPLGKPRDLWLSSAGLNVAFEDHPIYVSPMGKNTWSPVTDSPTRQRIRTTSEGVLINEGYTAPVFGKLSLLTGQGSKVLLSDNPTSKDQALWNFPPGLSGHYFPQEIAQISPVMRGEDLCLYFKYGRGMNDGKRDCIYYFAKGRKDGVKIPLAYDVSQVSKNKLAGFPSISIFFDSLLATDAGLVISATGRGFWFIPWSDIDAYVKSVSK